MANHLNWLIPIAQYSQIDTEVPACVASIWTSAIATCDVTASTEPIVYFKAVDWKKIKSQWKKTRNEQQDLQSDRSFVDIIWLCREKRRGHSCFALLLKVDFHLPSQLRLSITHRPPDDKRQMSCTSLYRCLIFKYLWLTLCIFSLPHPMVNTFSLLQNLFPHFGTICCVPLHNSCGPQMGPAPQFRNHCSRGKQEDEKCIVYHYYYDDWYYCLFSST